MKKLLYSILFGAILVAGVSAASVTTNPDITGIPSGGGIQEGTDVGFGNMTATSLTLSTGGSAASPTLNWGDGNTGLWEWTDNGMGFSVGGQQRLTFLLASFYGVANTFSIDYQNATSATSPTFSYRADINTGSGSAGPDQLSHIAGGVEALRNYTTYSEFYPSGAGQIRFYDDGDVEIDGNLIVSGSFREEIAPTMANYSIIGAFVDWTSVDRLALRDGNYLQIQETAGDPGFQAWWTFPGVTLPAKVYFKGCIYDGTNQHDAEAIIFSNTSSAWHDLRTNAVNANPSESDFQHTSYTDEGTPYDRTYLVPSPQDDYVDGSGNVLIGVTHPEAGSTADDWYCDAIHVVNY